MRLTFYPIWTTQRAYDFVRVKDEASFSHINWTDNHLSFRMNSSSVHKNGLTVMLPVVLKEKDIFV